MKYFARVLAAAVTIGTIAAASPAGAEESVPQPRRYYDTVNRKWETIKPSRAEIARYLQERNRRQVVGFAGDVPPGSIVADTNRRLLYFVLADGTAVRYGIGVGREGFEWAGVQRISRKAEWPGWTPPAEMIQRRPELPRYMAGGPENPLGARALYLGATLYRIHGTNEEYSIGQAVSSGCIRMMNDDVIDLYGRAKVGTPVYVIGPKDPVAVEYVDLGPNGRVVAEGEIVATAGGAVVQVSSSAPQKATLSTLAH